MSGNYMFDDFIIKSKDDLKNAVEKYGFLPFFENSIEGFSIEEHIAPSGQSINV